MKRILPRIISAVSLVMMLLSCTDRQPAISEQECMKFLYDNMSLPDKAGYSQDYYLANVRKTLQVRERMDWGIPDREFRHFVLPLRVNNEILDDFRTEWADYLCDRVEGMSLEEAVLEINHWCHEMATYKPSDARTNSPLATVRMALGRCGEESVLGVSALRAAGIPARQVYTPRWAHTDDNHAWVEAWVDGKWHFLGACEPEARLDMAWFNAPVSRALLLHTKVFGGSYDGPEGVISRTSAYTEINVTDGYVPVRQSVVTVLSEDGKPVKDASVEFKIYNYAEFYTVATYPTDAQGHASLSTGKGDMLAWAYKGDRFGFAEISSENTTVVLDHRLGDVFSADLDITPPVENPIPTRATQKEIDECAVRFEVENRMREERVKGNSEVLDAFLSKYSSRMRVAQDLLSSLSEKDLNDVTMGVLDDAMAHAGSSFNRYTDSPRIENEQLLPYFDVLSQVPGIRTAQDASAWVVANIKVDDDANPQWLRMPPVSVYNAKKADSFSRGAFFVALCRSNGIEARIDPVTYKVQYRSSGRWVDEYFGGKAPSVAPQGTLVSRYTPSESLSDPSYYRHFTLAKITDGFADLLTFDENEDTRLSVLMEGGRGLKLDEGYYLMTSGQRMADGGALVHLEFFNVGYFKTTGIPLVMRQSDTEISVIGTMDAEALFTSESGEKVSILSQTGRGYFIVAEVGDKDEPTNHAMRELEAISSDLKKWGRKIVILGKARPSGVGDTVYGTDEDGSVLDMLTSGCEKTSRTLPVVTVCDSFGRIVYYSQGYNTSLGEDLRRVISKL